MAYISIQHLTKDYGQGRGNFGIDIEIEKGEVFGFVGINGAGKTTLIRQLMGFLKPSSGSAAIDGLDCWKDSHEVKKRVGYLPGEIAFPDAATGLDFLKQQAELLDLTDMSYAQELTKRLQLDPTARLKSMSKGMKQKTAMVAALMHDPDILILDEPTTGLDPLMRTEFIDIIKAEAKKGKTIFMSTHMFDEVEQLCDRVGLIKDGRILAIEDVKSVVHNEDKTFVVTFQEPGGFEQFLQEDLALKDEDVTNLQVTAKVHDKQMNAFLDVLGKYRLASLIEEKVSLEAHINSFY